MSRKSKDKGINPELDKFISNLMTQVMNDPEASVTDKVKVKDVAELVAEEDSHYELLAAERESLRGHTDWFSYDGSAMMEE